MLRTNIFEKLDEYWDSDQSWIDELSEYSTEHLKVLEVNATALLPAAQTMAADEYWAWRASFLNTYVPSHKPPLDKVVGVLVQQLRCVRKVLEGR